VHRHDAGASIERRRFTGAIRPDEPGDPTGQGFKVQVFDGRPSAEANG
jgi:hypothetical protein